MTFNKQTAREICEAEAESDPDTSDWCNYHCKMGDLLPDALDRIEELEAENATLNKSLNGVRTPV
jgi:hypothetical protein